MSVLADLVLRSPERRDDSGPRNVFSAGTREAQPQALCAMLLRLAIPADDEYSTGVFSLVVLHGGCEKTTGHFRADVPLSSQWVPAKAAKAPSGYFEGASAQENRETHGTPHLLPLCRAIACYQRLTSCLIV